MNNIRKATAEDAFRIAEIIVFNYRLNFYPLFLCDEFYFGELQVSSLAKDYLDTDVLESTYVYDDGVVKGVVQLDGKEVKRLFVEPSLQGGGIGASLLDFAVEHCKADHLWALEKNTRAIRFYERHGFFPTDERKLEEDTTEYLVRLTKTDSR